MGIGNSAGNAPCGELPERQDFLESLLSSVSDLVWCSTSDGGRMLYVNPAVERLLGRPLAELHANPSFWFEVVHSEDRASVQEYRGKLSERGQLEQEYRIIRPDGEVRWLQERISTVFDRAGNPVGLGGIATDITKRKQTEQALRDTQAVCHSLVETLPLSVFRKDRDSRFIFGNRQFCELMNKSLEEFHGKTNDELFPADIAEKYRTDDLRVLQTGETLEETEDYSLSDGSRIHIQVLKGPICDAEGAIVGIQGMFWDVTAHKQAEEALRESERRMRLIIDTANDAFVAIDADGLIIDWNTQAEVTFGWTRDEALQRPLAEMFIPMRYREAHQAGLQKF